MVNAKAEIFKLSSRDELITYLGVMMVADDDDPHPTSESAINVNGLVGKEYVWSKESKIFESGSSPAIFKRGRIFDLGEKVYVFVFLGANANELKSITTDRFLNSFRLN